MATVKPDMNIPWARDGGIATPPTPENGWQTEIPPFQYQNWQSNRSDSFCKHVDEEGVPVWAANTAYHIGSIVKALTGGQDLYSATIDAPVAAPPSTGWATFTATPKAHNHSADTLAPALVNCTGDVVAFSSSVIFANNHPNIAATGLFSYYDIAERLLDEIERLNRAVTLLEQHR